jgi:hypothetical protein
MLFIISLKCKLCILLDKNITQTHAYLLQQYTEGRNIYVKILPRNIGPFLISQIYTIQGFYLWDIVPHSPLKIK